MTESFSALEWSRRGGVALRVLYHATVRAVRVAHPNAALAILFEILRALTLVIAIMAFLHVLDIQQMLLRGNAMVSVLSGVSLFLIHTGAMSAAFGAAGSGRALRHPGLSPMILTIAEALASLYVQVLALIVGLSLVHLAYAPVQIDDPAGATLALALAWFSGVGAGVLAGSMRPLAPKFMQIVVSFYARGNMFFSGKLVLAAGLSALVLPYFLWNPLFHCIDQARGAVFINYTARVTTLTYPAVFGAVCFLFGMMIRHRLQMNARLFNL